MIKIFILTMVFLSACATDWEKKGSYYRTIQTEVNIESIPSSKVFIENELKGETPFKTMLEYGRKINKKTREVSYWRSQPGLSVFLSIITLGVYIPFGMAPVDIETTLEETSVYQNNNFNLILKKEGYEDLNSHILVKGENELRLNYELVEKTADLPNIKN